MSASLQQQMQNEIARWKAAISTLDSHKLAAMRERLEFVAQGFRKIMAAPVHKRAEAYREARAELASKGVPREDIDAGFPPEYPGNENLEIFGIFTAKASELFEQHYRDRILADLPIDQPLPVGSSRRNRVN